MLAQPDAPVHVVAYDPGRPALLEMERAALAESHQHDREAYTEAKGPFIARVLHPRAEEEPLA